MTRHRFLSVLAILSLTAGHALAQQPVKAGAAPGRVDVAALEKAVADAPGPVGCWTNNTGEPIAMCEDREKGLEAFKKLYATDKAKAVAAIQKRIDEIPSPKGGYFPILAAATTKDKAFVPMLKKLADKQKENALGTWATAAIAVIETGKCTQSPPPAKLREICM